MASALTLFLYALAVAPIAFYLWLRRWGTPILLFYAGWAILMLAYWGWWQRPDLAIPERPKAASGVGPSDPRCRDAVQAMEERGLIIGRTRNQVRVRPDVWPQLPQEVRDQLTQCINNVAGRPQEIVAR
jgi:hypothetical protein